MRIGARRSHLAKGLVASLLLVAVLTGCAALFAPADPRPVAEITTQAEDLIRRKAYAGAAELYAKAIAKQPENGRYYLRRSELLEALGRDRDARETYLDGITKATKGTAEHIELMHRLALLAAEHLKDIDTAEDLLEQLPAGSAARFDLAAYLYYQAHQHELSIKALNQALERARDNDQKAIVLYHAALVYDSLNDEKNAVSSLFHAINNATHLGLIRDISALWAKVNASQPLPQPKEASH